MKKLFIVVFLVIISLSAAQAKQIIDGYMILPNKDTVSCKMVIPQAYRDHIDLYFSVTINDRMGNSTTYNAKQHGIIGFGFKYNNKPYDYVLKKDGRDEVFAFREATGNKLNLYYYDFPRPLGTNSSVSAIVNVYMLEDSSKNTVTVTNGTLSGYKKKIRKFVGNDPALEKLFEEKVQYFTDIKDFVLEANAQ